MIQRGSELFHGQISGLLCEVRATHISDKERISAEDGMILTLFVFQQVGRALHGMTRSMQYLECNISELEFLSVGSDDDIKACFCIWPIYDRRACFTAEIQVARNKIRVEVCFKNVFQFDTISFQAIEIRLHFAQRVNDHGLSIRGDIICALSEATGIDLFYIHMFNLILCVQKCLFPFKKSVTKVTLFRHTDCKIVLTS